MSDHTTSIGQDASGPVLSGTFNGAVALLQEARAASHDLPPELQNVNLRHFQLATARAVTELSSRIETKYDEDDRDRRERQKETDHYRDRLESRLGGLEALIKLMMTTLSVVQIVQVLTVAGLIVLASMLIWG